MGARARRERSEIGSLTWDSDFQLYLLTFFHRGMSKLSQVASAPVIAQLVRLYFFLSGQLAELEQSRLANLVIFRTWKGGIIVAAVIGLGVLVIVIPLIYGISATVGSSLSFPGLSAAQSSTLTTLVNNGGSALQLTSITETVVGAGIIILGIALYFRLR